VLLSRFDPKRRKIFLLNLFPHEFVDDRPVSTVGHQHIDYLPTQIVTKYFRDTYSQLTEFIIDGIRYRSSKENDKIACVLFYNHEEFLDALEFESSALITESP